MLRRIFTWRNAIWDLGPGRRQFGRWMLIVYWIFNVKRPIFQFINNSGVLLTPAVRIVKPECICPIRVRVGGEAISVSHLWILHFIYYGDSPTFFNEICFSLRPGIHLYFLKNATFWMRPIYIYKINIIFVWCKYS